MLPLDASLSLMNDRRYLRCMGSWFVALVYIHLHLAIPSERRMILDGPASGRYVASSSHGIEDKVLFFVFNGF